MIFNIDPTETIRRARSISLLLLDVDGVLTAGELFLNDSGEEIKAFNTLDGQGIKLLQGAGLEVGIISGRKSRLVQQRAENLGIKLLFQGREDKINALSELCDEGRYCPDQIAYVGDDLPDIKVMKAVQLALSARHVSRAIRRVNALLASRVTKRRAKAAVAAPWPSARARCASAQASLMVTSRLAVVAASRVVDWSQR